MKKIVNSNEAPEPIGPYSQAIISEKTLYMSGQIAIDRSTGNLVNSDIKLETHQVMKNIDFILNKAGYNFNDIVKCSIFIKDMGDFGSINEVYGQYFKENPPSRETVEVSGLPITVKVDVIGLPNNVNVEISCFAVRQ